MPLFKEQYAANIAWADEISAVCEEQSALTSLLIAALIRSEFWFLRQAHVASAVASGGQREYV